MKKTLNRIVPQLFLWALAIIILTTFGKPFVLRSYIDLGIGDCQKNPILCIVPSEEYLRVFPDKDYLKELMPYKFPRIDISLPKSFTAINEQIQRAYFKKKTGKQSGAVAYLLYEKPDFFTGLFPQVKKLNLQDNYDFLNRIMYARSKEINNLSDTLFVILKSIFTPDVGKGKDIKIAKFAADDKKGFITYNLSGPDNFFNCDIVNSKGEFFKLYLKDKGATLDIPKVLTIISTLNNSPNSNTVKN